MVKCPVCLNDLLKESSPAPEFEGRFIDCYFCGKFTFTVEAHYNYLDPLSGLGHSLSQLSRSRISHKIRTSHHSGTDDIARVTTDFLERYISDGCPGPTPPEQARNLIRYIGDQVNESGEKIDELPGNLFIIIGAPNEDLADQVLQELIDEQLITSIEDMSDFNVSLTLRGWEAYEEEKRGEFSGTTGFIALQFKDPVLDPLVRDVLKPAIKDGINYNLVDMRDVSQAGVIDNIMREQIRDAAFVLVDLTHDNAGAYWEAGYAEGLGKPVIYLCKETKFDEAKTHFDTNHCTTVLWDADKPEELKREIVATLRRSLNLFN